MARIFAIDDDPDTLWILGATLAAGGHELVSFTNPREGLAALETDTPELLLLDVMMPGITGWEVLEILRASSFGEHLPTILLSAIGDSPNRTRGLRLGADDFLSKPFDSEELLARVDRLLGRRSATSEYLSGGLSSYPLTELIQNLSQSGRSGRLVLKSGEGAGRIELKGGALMTARFGALEGSEAMVAMLTLHEGEFRFYDGAIAGSSSWALGLTPILLHTAWLEDELGRRQHLLPREGGLVRRSANPPPPVPEEFAELPMTGLLAALDEPMSVNTLAAKLGVAKATCQLALGWLLEQGAVCLAGQAEVEARKEEASPTADVVPLDEDLAVAVTELQQLALFRGFPGLSVNLDVLAASLGEWREMAPVIATLPDALLGEAPSLARSRIWSAGGGTVELPGEEGSARIRFALPSAASSVDGGPSAAVVLWASTDTPFDERQRLAREIERRAGKALLLYIETGAGTPFDPGARWGLPAQPPRTLLDLLTALAQSGV